LIISVTSAAARTPTYQQAAASTNSSPLQSIEKVANDVSAFAAKVSSVAVEVAPVIGTLGAFIDVFV
jgi:hypothetical protein